MMLIASHPHLGKIATVLINEPAVKYGDDLRDVFLDGVIATDDLRPNAENAVIETYLDGVCWDLENTENPDDARKVLQRLIDLTKGRPVDTKWPN